jgi:hypothetical protein
VEGWLWQYAWTLDLVGMLGVPTVRLSADGSAWSASLTETGVVEVVDPGIDAPQPIDAANRTRRTLFMACLSSRAERVRGRRSN